MISSFKNILLLSLFFVTFGVASTVIEDSRSRLVLEDMAYAPLNASALDGEVYRQYSVALPSNEKPTVRVAKVSLVPLQLPASKVDPVRIQPLFVGNPYMRDGLWICDIVVPLFEKRGKNLSLRKKFELSVEFAGDRSGGERRTFIRDGEAVKVIRDELSFNEMKEFLEDVYDTWSWEDVLNVIRCCYLSEWKHKYVPRDIVVLDGDYWKVEIRYDNGLKKCKFEGSNCFPYSFRKFLTLLEWNI